MTWRCDTCDLNWPHYSQYSSCCQCGAGCRSDMRSAMQVQEADRLAGALHNDRKAAAARAAQTARFDEWYAQREAAVLREALDRWPVMELG